MQFLKQRITISGLLLASDWLEIFKPGSQVDQKFELTKLDVFTIFKSIIAEGNYFPKLLKTIQKVI